MEITKTHKIIISIIVLAILLTIYIVFDKRAKNNIAPADNNISQNATTTTATSSDTVITGGGYTITQVTPKNEEKPLPKPIPDLNRPITTNPGITISADTIAFAQGKVTALQTKLKSNPADILAWLDLGMYQKLAGDYDGTAISWKYASKLAPDNYIPLGNLGNLYAYFLKDISTAETYYKEAITKGPTAGILYFQLAEIYRDLFKDLNKARVIVAQGLAKIPNDPSLLQLQASLK